MFESAIQTIRPYLTRRRIVIASVISAVALTGAIVGPPVFNALRYDFLVAEQQDAHGQLQGAQESAVAAQRAFESSSTDAMTAYTNIGAFMDVVDTRLLSNRDAYDELSASRDTLVEQGGIHETSWNPGVKVIWDPASTPRVPATTSPVTIPGLTFALERDRNVVANFEGAAEQMHDRAATIQDEIDRSEKLIEKVLGAAKKYGTSRDILNYDKADVLVKVRLAGVIGDLADRSLDPIARITAFQKAIGDLKKSHADAVAEEERIAKEKKRAEERAAEQARKAEADAKAAEEAERLAKEEAERKAQEEANRPKPTPTPTPTPDPTPTPGVPTPSPAPED